MQKIKGQESVLVTAPDYDVDRLADAVVRFGAGTAEIVKCAQNIVMPERWEREAKPAFVDDFSGAKGAEKAAFEQIVFGSLAGLGDGG